MAYLAIIMFPSIFAPCGFVLEELNLEVHLKLSGGGYLLLSFDYIEPLFESHETSLRQKYKLKTKKICILQSVSQILAS